MWVLIVSWYLAGAPMVNRKDYFDSGDNQRAVAMQEFASKDTCISAGNEAKKIAPGLKFVCVPK